MESPNWYSEYQTFQQLTNAAGEPFRFSGDLHYVEVYPAEYNMVGSGFRQYYPWDTANCDRTVVVVLELNGFVPKCCTLDMIRQGAIRGLDRAHEGEICGLAGNCRGYGK